MLYIYLPVLYYHGNLYVTERANAGGRGFPLSQRSFLFHLLSFSYIKVHIQQIQKTHKKHQQLAIEHHIRNSTNAAKYHRFLFG